MKRFVSSVLGASILLASVVVMPENSKIFADSKGPVFINEVMSSNKSALRDGDIDDPKDGSQGGAYSDWIELYNSRNETIDLTGYTLSDESATWTFPNCTIPASGYLLVWASDKNKQAKDGRFHTNFKISESGEALTLKSSNGTIVDAFKTVSLSDDQSCGRQSDGANNLVIFAKSTPLISNGKGIKSLSEPIFSSGAGFYTSAFDLKLSVNESDTKIYYTTDNSDPVPGAAGTIEYSKSILIKSRAGEANELSMISNISDLQYPWKAPKGEVFKCTTIKAVAVGKDGSKSKIVTNTYFVDPNMKTRYNFPVISLVTDNKNLFDNTTGIYVNGNYEKSGELWERPMHIEVFEKDGTIAFSQNVGTRINGAYTRKFAQKSFRVYADGEYGDKGKFDYDILKGTAKKVNGKSIKNFKRLIFRNGGNDWTGTMFRDEVIHSLVSHLKIDTQAYRPSALFLNGEYWGIYNIRERYDKEYLADHYSFDKGNVAILDCIRNKVETIEVQDGTEEDKKAFTTDITNYLKTNSITLQSTYEHLKTKMDIENFIDYNISQIFFGNTDWPGNNVSMWKYKTSDGLYHAEAPYGQDGRWRWLLKDVDFGLGQYGKSPTHDTLSYATSSNFTEYNGCNYPWAVFLLKTLLQNTEFRNQFINRFADNLNTTFDSDRIIKRVDEAKSSVEAAMPEQINRWQAIKTAKAWNDSIRTIKDYAVNRPSNVRKHIQKKFGSQGVTGAVYMNLNSEPSQGYIKVNSIDIKSSTPGVKNASNWKGTYFKGVPITLKAIAGTGYKFDRWEGVSGTSATSDTISINPSVDMKITAVYKQVQAPTIAPTAIPTITPTETVTPTVTPTAIPTVAPTETVTPTAIPTVAPTETVTPTVTLTTTPAVTLTITLTATPTVTPTIAPTATPTITPTVTLTATPTIIPTETPMPGDILYGDVNGDNMVDSADYSYLRKYLLGIVNELPGKDWRVTGDVNVDGIVDSADYTGLRGYLIKMIKKLPIKNENEVLVR